MKINAFTKTLKQFSLAALAVGGLGLMPASAQNPNFAPGDLMLYFLQFGGSQAVIFNLGAAFIYRDAAVNIPNIINVNATLTGTASPSNAGYPTNWYDDPSIYWGLAAVRSNSTSTTAQVNGDPGRTLYLSQPRVAVGSDGVANSQQLLVDSNGSMTTGSNGVIALNNRIETLSTTNRFVEPYTTSTVDNQNPFLGSNPGTAYEIIPGGVIGKFDTGTLGTIGGVNAEAALDLYRVLATTNPTGTIVESGDTILNGSYQGTFIVNQTGNVSYIAPVPEPSTLALLGGSAVFGLIRRRRTQRA